MEAPPTPPVALGRLLADHELGLRHLAGPAEAALHGVHASEMTDPSPYLLGGELLLTAGAGLAGATAAAAPTATAQRGAARGGSAPGGAVRGGSAPGGSVQGGSAPGDSAQGSPGSGGSVRGGPGSGGTVRGGPGSGGTAHGGSAPGDSAQGSPAPGGSSHGGSAPGGSVHGDPAPGGSVQSSPGSGSSVRGGSAPGGSVHGDPVPRGSVQSSPGSGVSAQGSPAPGDSAHSSPAPGGSAHDSPAPGGSVHGDPAPGGSVQGGPGFGGGAEPGGTDAGLYVARLVRAGVGALGFGVTPVHETVPRALVEACDRYGLPLVEVPPGTPFTAVGRSVWRLMEQARTAELRRVTEAQQSLAAAAARPDPVPAVLRRLAATLGGWAGLLPAPRPNGPGATGPGSTGAGTVAAGPGRAGPGAAGPGAARLGSAGPGAAGSSTAWPGATGPGATGPGAAGPSTAGPSTAGPGKAGPSTAWHGPAGPSTAGHGPAGPSTAGPSAAGRRPAPTAGLAGARPGTGVVAGPAPEPRERSGAAEAVPEPASSGPAGSGGVVRAPGAASQAGAAAPGASAGPVPEPGVLDVLHALARRVAGGSAVTATAAHGGLHLSVHALGDGWVLAVATPVRAPGDHTVASVAAVLLTLLTARRTAGAEAALTRLLLGGDPAGALGPGPWYAVHARGTGDPRALAAALGTVLLDPDPARADSPHTDTVRLLTDREPGPQPGWRLGVSAPTPAAGLPGADAQAGRALERAEAARTALARHTEAGFAGLVGAAEARAHAEALLGPLPPVLRDTLRGWLAHHGSWDRSAAALGVHRNTVRQRVARAAALLARDLDDPDVRMELWFALRVAAAGPPEQDPAQDPAH
ncbi:helix-turn-helix domain-containing protein [Streptomyces sp. NPDC002104]